MKTMARTKRTGPEYLKEMASLREQMVNSGMKMTAFAEAINVKQNRLSEMFSGKLFMRQDQRAIIRQMLNDLLKMGGK